MEAGSIASTWAVSTRTPGPSKIQRQSSHWPGGRDCQRREFGHRGEQFTADPTAENVRSVVHALLSYPALSSHRNTVSGLLTAQHGIGVRGVIRSGNLMTWQPAGGSPPEPMSAGWRTDRLAAQAAAHRSHVASLHGWCSHSTISRQHFRRRVRHQ